MASKYVFAMSSRAHLLARDGGVVDAGADAPRQLKWADLVPKNIPAAGDEIQDVFRRLGGAETDGPPPPPLPEGNFMSVKRRQPGSDRPPAIVAELDGQSVRSAVTCSAGFRCDDG